MKNYEAEEGYLVVINLCASAEDRRDGEVGGSDRRQDGPGVEVVVQTPQVL